MVRGDGAKGAVEVLGFCRFWFLVLNRRILQIKLRNLFVPILSKIDLTLVPLNQPNSPSDQPTGTLESTYWSALTEQNWLKKVVSFAKRNF